MFVPKWKDSTSHPFATFSSPLLQFLVCRVLFGPAGFYPCAVGWHLIPFVLITVPVVVAATCGLRFLEKEIARGEI